MKIEVGDIVRFIDLLTDDHKLWFVPNEAQFDVIKTMLGKIGTVTHVRKHYVNTSESIYYLDVDFQSSGRVMKRVNSLCFEKVDMDFDFV